VLIVLKLRDFTMLNFWFICTNLIFWVPLCPHMAMMTAASHGWHLWTDWSLRWSLSILLVTLVSMGSHRPGTLSPIVFPSISLTEVMRLLGNDLISRYAPCVEQKSLVYHSISWILHISACSNSQEQLMTDQTNSVGFLQGSDASPVLGTLESPRNIPESETVIC